MSSSGRFHWMDWLRGLMVLLMVQAHLLDSWLAPETKGSGYPEFVRVYLNGIPSRVFLFLLGMAVTIRLERPPDASDTRSPAWLLLRRGLALLAIAYLFRIQQLAMRGFRDWDLGRVDILNCLAATMLLIVLALASLPTGARPWTALALSLAFFALGPVLGTTRISQSLPEAVTAYLGGARPLAWFPLFPWAGWGLLGAAAGHPWLRAASAGRVRCAFVTCLLAGAALTATGLVLEELLPWPYRSEVESDMGLARTVLYLGLIGLLCALGGLVSSDRDRRPAGPLVVLGRGSLLIYWLHIELVYGRLTSVLHGRLSLPAALAGLVTILGAMLAVTSVLSDRRSGRTKVSIGPPHWHRMRRTWKRARGLV